MKMTDILKKYVLPNLPYLIFLWFFAKVGEAVRLAPGVDASTKLLGLADGFTLAFQTSMPGAAVDWLVGLIGAALVRLVVYVKGKNAKKYRKDVEYGSARWGTKADIAPFMDPKPENNIILTQTEGLMMSGRPKNPAFARNKNVLVVGGSGSGGLTMLEMREWALLSPPRPIPAAGRGYQCGRNLEGCRALIRVEGLPVKRKPHATHRA